MRCSLRSLLLSSVLGVSLLATPLAASQGGSGGAGKAAEPGQAQAQQPPQPDQAVQQAAAENGAGAPQTQETGNPSTPATESRADLRTFGGKCIRSPVGDYPQVGALVAAFIPQLVGAGIDALTAALDAAGRDRTLSQSTVVALESAVSCVQIARRVTVLSGSDSDTLRNALEGAPFLVELFLRQSADGSALLVSPTLLNYRETLDRHLTSRPRTLYVTLTFTEPGSQRTSAVTVPLGAYATRPDAYTLDAVGAPFHPDSYSSLGAANSVWIPNPFRTVGSTELKVPDQPQTGSEAPPQPQQEQHRQGRQSAGQPVTTHNAEGAFGDATPHQTPVDPAAPANSEAPDGGQAPPPAPKPPVGMGTAIMPLSITVAISEVRPGSAVARFLAGVLRGTRPAIVNALDPAQRETARQAELTAAAELATNVRNAEKTYADAFRAYCGAARVERITKVSELREAHLNLLAALQAAHQPPPARLGDPISAEIGQPQADDDKMCAGYPGYVTG